MERLGARESPTVMFSERSGFSVMAGKEGKTSKLQLSRERGAGTLRKPGGRRIQR
jgi:hypothetical protein